MHSLVYPEEILTDLVPLDFTSKARDSDKVQSHIVIGKSFRWITSGGLHTQFNSGLNLWTIGCRWTAGVTDREHDSAWVFKFDAVGLTFDQLINGWTFLKGFIGGDSEDFRVPNSVDEVRLRDQTCTRCDKPHQFAAQYLPPENFVLWNKMRGLPFMIQMGPI